MSDTKSLGDALPDEIKRVTEILGHYGEIGPVATFGVVMTCTELNSATRAIASGDSRAT
ncbi:hypothetical protein [Paraburkholderia sp. SIMBA_030]|uniref:hypothetical protein n=1 Tax=Paraburkholderia sp. SIMBA_030 TaxID=3085773 RepID=UPI003979CBCF